MNESVPVLDHSGHEGEGIAHIVSFRTLTSVFLGLLLLTVLTVSVAGLDLGSLSLLMAMGIATIKASLVALYFMHLRYDNPFYGLIFVTALLFLAIFLGLTLLDTLQYQPEIESYRQSQSM